MVIKKENWRGAIGAVISRMAIVTAILFLLLLLGTFPLQVGKLGEVRPFFILIAVYFWSMTRPSILPVPIICLVGILFDLLAGYPLGVTALVLMAVHALVKSQRKYLMGQSFRVIWAGMAIVAFATAAVEWLLFSLFYGDVVPLLPVLMSALMTTAFFPLFLPLLARLNKRLAEGHSEG